jgi:hypothetical protein
MSSAAFFVVMSVAVAAIGAPAAAALRGAGTMMGPVNILLAYLDIGLLTLLMARSAEGDVRLLTRVAPAMALCVAAWSALLLALPPQVGAAFLGESWSVVRDVLPWTCLEYLALAVVAPAMIGLRSRSASSSYFQVRVLFGTLVVSLGATAALVVRETWAVSAALALAALMTTLLAWIRLVGTPPVRAAR